MPLTERHHYTVQQHLKNDYPVEYVPPTRAYQADNSPSISPETVNKKVPTNTVQSTSQEKSGLKKKQILIYHSHNRESWLPELKNVKDPDLALDPNKNVTLLGSRLQQKMEDAGIGSIHSKEDYPSAIKDFNYPKSYEYSKNTIQQALASQSNLTFMFDLHRDSQKRDKPTITINKKEFAQVYFVVLMNVIPKYQKGFTAKIRMAMVNTINLFLLIAPDRNWWGGEHSCRSLPDC